MSWTIVGIAVPTIRPSSIDSSIASRMPSMIQRMFFGTTGMSSTGDAVDADMPDHCFLAGRDAYSVTNMFVTNKFGTLTARLRADCQRLRDD